MKFTRQQLQNNTNLFKKKDKLKRVTISKYWLTMHDVKKFQGLGCVHIPFDEF